MAEEAAKAEAPAGWPVAWPSALSFLLERQRLTTFVLPTFFFFLALFAYWYLGPKDNPYVHHVNQANAFLHGHLDLEPEYTKNLHTLERALDDEQLREVEQGITPPPCGEVKCYLSHPPMPAILLLPFVVVGGLDVNQALFSVVLGAITAILVYRVTSGLVESIRSQVWLTVLFLFGTIFWYITPDGGVWYVSHIATVMFLFAAIHATLSLRSPLWAGVFLGAAYLSRNTTAMTLPFFVIMFADKWAPRLDGLTTLRSKVSRFLSSALPVALPFAIGALPFVIFSFGFNYLRFGDPLDSAYNHSEQIFQPGMKYVYPHGIFHYSYIPRHFQAMFETMPILQTSAPYVLPSLFGQAIWATTPAFLYAFFATMRRRWMVMAGIAAILIMIGVVASKRVAGLWDGDWETYHLPRYVHLWPFFLLVGAAVASSAVVGARAVRDGTWRENGARQLLPAACWAGILPVAFSLFFFAATGWAQFGYRYALDFYPFLFLLVVWAAGNQIRWHHKALILASVVINAWAVFWVYEFQRGAGPFPQRFLGLDWVTF